MQSLQLNVATVVWNTGSKAVSTEAAVEDNSKTRLSILLREPSTTSRFAHPRELCSALSLSLSLSLSLRWRQRQTNRRGSQRERVQCCFTSTETIKAIRDGESRSATSTFTPLLSSEREIPILTQPITTLAHSFFALI